MGPETVNVYKDDSVVTCNKSDVEIWLEAGYEMEDMEAPADEGGQEDPDITIGDETDEENTNPETDEQEED